MLSPQSKLAFSTVIEWLEALEKRHPSVIELGLDRVEKVAQRLGVQHFSCPVIMVAGTNGKGSTVATLDAIYRAAGYQVATYTSPHLRMFNERIRYQGKTISDADLLAAFSRVEAHREPESLTYFEFTTLASLVFFQVQKPDIIILEIGLGGRLDAVNIVEPDVAVVTNIGLDHCDYLGSTLDSIAREKAGVFRANKPAISGDPQAPRRLYEEARARSAQWLEKGKDFSFRVIDEHTWEWSSAQKQLQLPMPRLSLENVATALMAVEALGLAVSHTAIAEGVSSAFIEGRFQTVQQTPQIILDVAHNPHGVSFLLKQLAALPDVPTKAVFAMLADKDIEAVIGLAKSAFVSWYIADLSVPRAQPANKLAESLVQQGCHVSGIFENVAFALQQAHQDALKTDRIVVFGSFYTVAAALEALPLGR